MFYRLLRLFHFSIHVFHRSKKLTFPIIIDLRLVHRANVKFTRDSSRIDSIVSRSKNRDKNTVKKRRGGELREISMYVVRLSLHVGDQRKEKNDEKFGQ